MASQVPTQAREAAVGGRSDRLDSWKEIASYLNKDVRTVQRWEKSAGLPIHRQGQVGAVYALRSELDDWLGSVKAQQRRIPTWKQALIAALAVTSAAALIAIAWLWPTQSPSNSRLVILPFDNLSADVQQEYFARGISDDLTSEFGRLQSKQLKVIARATAERYKGKDLGQIGHELQVQYVVEGSVRRDGERIRLNAQLIQVSDQSQLWAKSYDESISTALSLPGELARQIQRELLDRIDSQPRSTISNLRLFISQPRPTRLGTQNPKAYDEFLHGRYFWSKRGVDSMAKGMSYFRAAITDDPNFAAAYAGLADGLALLGSTQSGILRPTEAFPQARQAAEKALSLDESLPEAHASLAYISLVYDRDLAKAKSEFERAIQLNPSYSTAHQWYGLYYDAIGDTAKAIESVTRAKEHDSLSLAVNIALAESYYFARDYEHAAERAQAALELDNNSALAHFNLGRVLLQKHQYPEALVEFQYARADAPNAATVVMLGYTYGRVGDFKQARLQIEKLDEAAKSQYVPAIYYAVIYMGLGDKDRAFAWLDRAFAERCDYLVFLPQDPLADSLRDDSRFKDLLNRIGTSR